MKTKTRKFSWFQKLILGYLVFISFFIGLKQYSSPLYRIDIGIFSEAIGYATGSTLFVLLFMWLFNKYVANRIKTENKILKKVWKIIQLFIVGIIIIWFILFLYGIWRYGSPFYV